MKKTFCDLCGAEITDEKNIRYVRVIKLHREFSNSEVEEKPDMPELEICSICGTRLKDHLSKVPSANKGKGNAEL